MRPHGRLKQLLEQQGGLGGEEPAERVQLLAIWSGPASGCAVEVTVIRPDAVIALVKSGEGVATIAGLIEVAVEVDVAARAGDGGLRRAALFEQAIATPELIGAEPAAVADHRIVVAGSRLTGHTNGPGEPTLWGRSCRMTSKACVSRLIGIALTASFSLSLVGSCRAGEDTAPASAPESDYHPVRVDNGRRWTTEPMGLKRCGAFAKRQAVELVCERAGPPGE